MQAHEATKQWRVPLIDVGDGSGDCILELPDEVVTSLGWREGDVLEVEQLTKGEFVLRKKATTES
jgi:hypothetical protein